MEKRKSAALSVLLVLLMEIISISYVRAEGNIANLSCPGGICVEDGTIILTSEDITSLKEVLKKDEHADHKYEIISIKSIISGQVYLLSASKPDYYGIQIVLSKKGPKWTILKKVKSIY